jgi:hypothetical protein
MLPAIAAASAVTGANASANAQSSPMMNLITLPRIGIKGHLSMNAASRSFELKVDV